MSLVAASAALATTPLPPRDHALGVLSRLAWADFLERTRQPAYQVSLLVMAWLAHGMLPSATAGYRTFSMQDEFRPVYGPEWVGALVGTLSALYFVLVGFYLVKGAVERDRRTGVGQILAASRVSRLGYVAGKSLSNLLVLGSMLVVALGVALVTQQLLGEDRTFAPFAAGATLFAIALPVAAVVAAAAVLIECVPGLAGGLGNVVWFVASMALLSIGILDAEGQGRLHADLLGFSAIAQSTYQTLHALHPAIPIDVRALSMGVNVDAKWAGVSQQTFPWPGLSWDIALLMGRLLWFGVAAACALLAAVVFDRFDRPARVRVRGASGLPAWVARRLAPANHAAAAIARASELAPAPRGRAALGLVRAEFALLVHGQGAPWWFAALGLMIATLLAPLDAVRQGLLPVIAIWPVLVLGSLGARDRLRGTEALLLSAPRPVTRQLAAAWLAGALLVAALGAFALLRFVVAGRPELAGGWLFASALVPALALALGTWTGGSKFFEVLLLFAWYVGPMHRIAALDFTGVTTARSPALWLGYATFLVGLLALAWLGRARRVQR